jgi:hypothetical protein
VLGLVVELDAKQPHLVVYLPNDIEPEEAHIICFTQIRMLANGQEYCGDADLMIRLLARALLDAVGD